MKSLVEIIEKIKEIKPYLLEKYGVSQIGIFGSYAYGMPKAESDVDVLVDFNRPIGIEFVDLCDDLDKFIGIKTDVATVSGLLRKPKLFEDIKEDLIYV